MMKYIFCILFGSLLMLGFHYTPDEKVQEAQPNAGVVAMDVQSDTRLAQKISVTVAGQSYGGSHAFRNTTTPSKVLRFCSATIVQMLCLSDTQLPENKWRGLSPDTNYIKYSNGYYVYTLGHILI